MQLNEIIEENTLSAISRKTRLSVENLEKLLDHNFQGFRKVQALGFIAILEREYRADLSDLRAQCQAYFLDEGTKDELGHLLEPHVNSPHKRSGIVEIVTGKKQISYIKPFVVTLIVAGVLYAAWQTYSSGRQLDDVNTSRPDQESGFFVSIINQAKMWMGTQEASLEGEDVSFETNETVVTEKKNTDENTFVIAEKPSQNQTNEVSKTVQETDDVIRKIKEEQALKLEQERQQTAEAQLQKLDDAIAAATEDNSSESDILATEVPSITSDMQQPNEEQNVVKEVAKEETQANLDEEKPAEEASNEMAAQEEAARIKAQEDAALKNEAALKKEAEAKAAQEEAAKIKAAKAKAAKAAQERAAKAKIVVLKPRKKTWLGIVNLTNMKRRVATAKTPQTFDTSKGRWIVATGHGYIDFDEGVNHKKFNDGKQHFLLIQKGKVAEIPHEKFQQLNKSKVW
jgi:chemotaxis protein histidine kinase CheA